MQRFSEENQGGARYSKNFYYLLGSASLIGGMMAFNNKSRAEAEGETLEIEIDFASTLKDGEMKELKVGPKDEDKVLISRYQGKLHAVGNYCSHFGAPLSTGLMFDDKVLCPWHAASFSVITGTVENAPGMDGLPIFTITEKDGKAFVTVPVDLPRKHTQTLAKRDLNDKRRYVIIGGGPAGVNCAEALRQSNYTGEITVIAAEDMVAYDRTLLTKVLPSGDASKFKLRSDEFLKNADIDFKLGTKAESVDTAAKSVKLSDGTTIVRLFGICIIMFRTMISCALLLAVLPSSQRLLELTIRTSLFSELTRIRRISNPLQMQQRRL